MIGGSLVNVESIDLLDLEWRSDTVILRCPSHGGRALVAGSWFMRTYTQVSGGIFGRMTDIARLYKVRTRNVQENVEMTKAQVAASAECYAKYTAAPLVDRDVLVVGVGQTQREATGLGMKNRVVGIDLDVIPQGWHPGQYVRLLKQNGGMRSWSRSKFNPNSS